MNLLKPHTTQRRLHSELHSRAEQAITNAIAEVQALSKTNSNLRTATIKMMDARSTVADYIDEHGENNHHWDFDAERGGVHCTKCHKAKNLASQDNAPCAGDVASIHTA